MDEVHYLADRVRGAVWEEVIIHLPGVGGAGLAVGDGVATPRSSASGWRPSAATPTTIVEERRPVPLYQHVMVGRRLLRPVRRRTPTRRPARRSAQVNPELLRLARDDWASSRMRDRRRRKRDAPRGRGRAPGRQRPRGSGSRAASTSSSSSTAPGCCRRSSSSSAGSAATPRSSSACNANLRLTTPEERDEIFAVRRGALPPTCPTRTCTCSATTTSSTG